MYNTPLEYKTCAKAMHVDMAQVSASMQVEYFRLPDETQSHFF